AARQFQADDALPEAQDLGVVAEYAALDGITVVRGGGANAGDLVGCYGDTQTGAADQQRAVGLAGGDFLGGGDGHGGIGRVGIGVDTNVFDGGYVFTGLQVGLEGLLVLITGVVATNDDSQLVAHFNSVDGRAAK